MLEQVTRETSFQTVRSVLEANRAAAVVDGCVVER